MGNQASAGSAPETSRVSAPLSAASSAATSSSGAVDRWKSRAASVPEEKVDESCKTCVDKEGTVRGDEALAGKCIAYQHSGCPLNRKEVGRATWAFLHTMAAYYPQTPSQRQQDDMKQFMLQLGRVYPCGYCADRSADEMEINPPRVSSQKEFAQWMCELHNEVNFRMNKPIFDCSKVAERWRTGPPDGSCS